MPAQDMAHLFGVRFRSFLGPVEVGIKVSLESDSVQGGMVDSKSYCTVVNTRCDETSQATNLSPGQESPDLTTCDTETSEPDHPPLAHAPRDEITACDQVPHSDVKMEWGA